MPSICPECGAVLAKGTGCQDIFDEFLVLEFTDPGYGEVHMLTVACFMIQHGRYSDEALGWMEQKLRENLEDGKPAAQIRREARGETQRLNRGWKVTRPADAPPQKQVAWTMTIGDVAGKYADAAGYRELVKEWARATVRDMQPLITRR